MIVVVEGPSAAGKTTWCARHAPRWSPEPGRGPIEQVLRHQVERWRQAVVDDAAGEVVVLDGDPFKLYFSWAEWRLGRITAPEWEARVDVARGHFLSGDHGLADLVLYSDPGEDELRRRKVGDHTRSRRNFERHTAMRRYVRRWYEAVAHLDPTRVVWEHPAGGLSDDLLGLGPRARRSDPALLDELLAHLAAEP